MAVRALLLTNNPEYLRDHPKNADLRFVDGQALDVLVAARDLAHQGWVLANHPLYGNYRPHQQPYRSLLMMPPGKGDSHHTDARENPLRFLEEALALYQSPVRKCVPAEVPEHMRKDCALVDRELLRATLESLY